MRKAWPQRFREAEISPGRIYQAGLRRSKDFTRKLLRNSAALPSAKNRECLNYYQGRHNSES